MPFATIDTTTLTIWATGDTAEEAAEYAGENIAYARFGAAATLGSPDPVVGPLETMECTDAVIERIEAWGGEFDNSPGEEWTIYTRADGSKLLNMVNE